MKNSKVDKNKSMMYMTSLYNECAIRLPTKGIVGKIMAPINAEDIIA